MSATPRSAHDNNEHVDEPSRELAMSSMEVNEYVDDVAEANVSFQEVVAEASMFMDEEERPLSPVLPDVPADDERQVTEDSAMPSPIRSQTLAPEEAVVPPRMERAALEPSLASPAPVSLNEDYVDRPQSFAEEVESMSRESAFLDSFYGERTPSPTESLINDASDYNMTVDSEVQKAEDKEETDLALDEGDISEEEERQAVMQTTSSWENSEIVKRRMSREVQDGQLASPTFSDYLKDEAPQDGGKDLDFGVGLASPTFSDDEQNDARISYALVQSAGNEGNEMGLVDDDHEPVINEVCDNGCNQKCFWHLRYSQCSFPYKELPSRRQLHLKLSLRCYPSKTTKWLVGKQWMNLYCPSQILCSGPAHWMMQLNLGTLRTIMPAHRCQTMKSWHPNMIF